ncbi:MAG: hypothetical protein GY696_32830, partial [Gammaproteobacteria bacterium]|nr:hypothetical protein [Gammaproteobacteria bacterium]
METLAAYISANDINKDKESPNNEIADMDYISDMEHSDKENTDKESTDKYDTADENIAARENITAKDYIATGIKDKEESPVSPADPSRSGSPSRSHRALHPEQEPKIRRPRCLLTQDPAGRFDFRKNKDVTLSRHGQDGAASSNR